MDTNLGQPPARGGRGPYRHHPVEFKRTIVEQSRQAGVSVSRLAREHGINANQVFAWRKAYQEGRLDSVALLPVTVSQERGSASIIDASGSGSGRLILERRGARLTIEGQADAQTLGQVLAALLG